MGVLHGCTGELQTSPRFQPLFLDHYHFGYLHVSFFSMCIFLHIPGWAKCPLRKQSVASVDRSGFARSSSRELRIAFGKICRCLHIFRNLPHAFSPPSATSFAPVVLNLPQICTCEASKYTFRVEAGEGCVSFACAAACPLPCFSPFSSFPLFGRAFSAFSERFFNHLRPPK